MMFIETAMDLANVEAGFVQALAAAEAALPLLAMTAARSLI
jgi:hypothetical protein